MLAVPYMCSAQTDSLLSNSQWTTYKRDTILVLVLRVRNKPGYVPHTWECYKIIKRNNYVFEVEYIDKQKKPMPDFKIITEL
jgi:hypothetical protein